MSKILRSYTDPRDRACCKKCGFKRSEKNVSKTGRLHDAQYFDHVVHFFNPSSSDQNRGGVPETQKDVGAGEGL